MKLKEKTIRLLEKLGLSQKEAEFYYNAYKTPNQSVTDIQKNLKISRATAYRFYDKLRELKIVLPSNHENTSNVVVAPFTSIARQLSSQGRKLKKLELECRNLDSLINLGSRGFQEDGIEIFTEKNQIIDHNYKILHKKWDHLLALGSSERLLDVVGDEHEKKFVELRNRLGRSCDLYLTEFGPYAAYHLPNDQREMRNTRLIVDPKKQDFMMYMYDGEVTIWHRDKILGPRAVVITDPLLVQLNQNMFHTVWNMPVSK